MYVLMFILLLTYCFQDITSEMNVLKEVVVSEGFSQVRKFVIFTSGSFAIFAYRI